MMPLLATKLHRPLPPTRLVSRPFLTERLTAGIQSGCSVTLVSAPAGFGKSTCVCEWIGGLAYPAAWLALDPEENDPLRFFAYLVAALQQIDQMIGRDFAPTIQAGQLPPPSVTMSSLLADIQNFSRPFLLVLDDFHVLHDAAILKAFEVLLGHQPDNLHLVLITREDPQLSLARLRANQRLQEVRAENLRFSTAEAEGLLQALGLHLSSPDLMALVEKTEGWVVGLQLAAVAMKGSLLAHSRVDPSDFIARLSSSHRFILSYLIEEVLSRQPEALQAFLLQTALLDRLSAGLCNAVTGRTDSAVVLESLLAANLFLVPLESTTSYAGEETWYRYHHLFAELLAGRLKLLQGPQAAQYYQRASAWFAQVCTKSTVFERPALAGEAIRYALAAEDYASAVALVETHISEMMNQWYARTVNVWMDALPAEWSARSPRANLAFARMHLMQGNLPQASQYLARLKMLFSGDLPVEAERALKAEFFALQSMLSGAQGNAQEALVLAKEALETAVATGGQALSQVYLALAVSYQQIDNIPQATEAYQKLIAHGQQSGDLVTEVMGLSALALMMIQRGQLRSGFQLATQGAARAERLGGFSPVCAGIYGELGQVYFHWGQFDQAEAYFERAAQTSVSQSFSDAAVFQSVARSRLAQIRGDLPRATQEIQKAADLMRADAPVVVREEVVAQQVHLALAQNDLSAAEQILAQETGPIAINGLLAELASGQPIAYPRCLIHLSALRVQLEQLRQKRALGEPGQPVSISGAIAWTERLLTVLLDRQFVPLAIEARLLRAQFLAVADHRSACLAELGAAIALAEPDGYLSLFALEGSLVQVLLQALLAQNTLSRAQTHLIQKILALFPPPASPVDCSGVPAPHPQTSQVGERAPLPEPLTGREMEVLQCMAAGQTYEQIAGRLVVSINTVRTHVKSIYSKLGVNNRTAALETARQYMLL